jgi:hypothetical protein
VVLSLMTIDLCDLLHRKYYELELGRLQDRQVGRFGAVEQL